MHVVKIATEKLSALHFTEKFPFAHGEFFHWQMKNVSVEKCLVSHVTFLSRKKFFFYFTWPGSFFSRKSFFFFFTCEVSASYEAH